MEPDGGEMLDAEVGAPRRRWVRWVAVLAVLGLVVASGAAIWERHQPPEEQWCIGAGTIDGPIASSPGAAVAAWVARGGAQDAQSMTDQGAGGRATVAPSARDFRPHGSGIWEWRYSPTGAVQLEVTHTDVTGGVADGWTVSGVGQCTLGHQNVQGPSTGG